MSDNRVMSSPLNTYMRGIARDNIREIVAQPLWLALFNGHPDHEQQLTPWRQVQIQDINETEQGIGGPTGQSFTYEISGAIPPDIHCVVAASESGEPWLFIEPVGGVLMDGDIVTYGAVVRVDIR